MDYYKSIKNYPSIKKVTLNTFSQGVNGEVDENLLTVSYAKYSYNFNYESGVLTNSVGVDYLDYEGNRYALPKGVYPIKIYFYDRYDVILGKKDERLIVYASDKAFYYIKLTNSDGFKLFDGLTMENAPKGINYNYDGQDVFILSKDGEGLIIINGDEYQDVELTPSVSSMCMHAERLFITTKTDKKTVWFSDDFDPSNWQISIDKAGYITLEDDLGDMLNVLSFHGYVYLFRSYGISVITAYGNQEEFYTNSISVSHGRIYENTPTDCGDYVIYLTDDGLYRFNGSTSTKIMTEIDNYIVNAENAKGCFSGGKYYLICDMKFENDDVERGVLVYDVKSKQSHILRYIPIIDFCKLNGETRRILASAKNVNEILILNDSGKFLNKTLRKVWQSAFSDFQIDKKRKRLEKMSVDIEGNIYLKIQTESQSKLFLLKGRGRKEIFPNLLGDKFSFTISSNYSKVKVSKPILYFSYFKE